MNSILKKTVANFPEERKFRLKDFDSHVVYLLKQVVPHDNKTLYLVYRNGQPLVDGNGDGLKKEDRKRLFAVLKAFRDSFGDKQLSAEIKLLFHTGGGIDRTQYVFSGVPVKIADDGIPWPTPRQP